LPLPTPRRRSAARVYAGRAPVADLTDVNDELMFATGYRFARGVDDLIREGCDAVLVSYGDALQTCLDLVEQMLGEGISVGLVGKATLDQPDPAMLARLAQSPALLLVDCLPAPLGLAEPMPGWLEEHGFSGRYAASVRRICRRGGCRTRRGYGLS
jgi:pyruvate/2-oxoglutarate/acetoin dehydrogenase E1 component